MPRRQSQHGARVEPAAEVAADGHIGAEPEVNRLIERPPELFDMLGIRPPRSGPVSRWIVEIPVADQPDLTGRGDQVVPRRDLVHALEERAVLRRRMMVDGAEDAVAVPAGRDAGREQRLGLRGDYQHVTTPGVIQRLDPKSVPRREELLRAMVPEDEGELAAELFQAAAAELFVQVQGDLAVRPGLEPMAAPA